MTIPAVTETVRSDGLNTAGPVSMLAVAIGPSDGAVDVNTFALYSDANALKDAAGDGKGVLLGCALLAKGGPIGFVRAAASVAGSVETTRGTFTEDGSAGSVTQSDAGPLITVNADNATRSCDIEIEVTTAGTLGTAAFTYAIDGGAASDPVTTAVAPGNTFTVPDTGVVVTFPAGTYVESETYDFTVTQGGGEITPSGTPNHDVEARIEILEDGGLGEAKFRIALDTYDGDTVSERTYSDSLVVPAGGTHSVPNQGLTLTFADEDFFAGDVYTFGATAAGMNATNLADAFEALVSTDIPWRFCAVGTGDGEGDETAHGLLAAALQSQLSSLAADSVYRRGMIATGGASAADAFAEFNDVAADRALTAYGKVRMATIKPTVGFAFPTVPAVFPISARASESLASTDLKRVADGPLSEVVKMLGDSDSYKNPNGLETIRVSSLRTWKGRGGSAYITGGFLKSASGSSFKLWPHGIVIDIACEIAHDELIDAVGRGLRTYTRIDGANSYPGVVDPRDAGTIESAVMTRLNNALITPINAEGTTGYVQDIAFEISETHDFLSSEVIVANLSVLPFGYVSFVNTSVGFVVEI